MLTRRDFIKYTGLAMNLGSLPLWAQAGLEDHINIAEKIKKKFKGKEVTLLYPDGSLANIKPVASLFSELTGVKVNLLKGSLDSISSEVILASKLGEKNAKKIDLALPATFRIPDLVEANSIIDLTKYSGEYEPRNFKKGRYYDLGDYYQGKFYGYQADGDVYLMFYNRDWLESPKNRDQYSKKFGKELKVAKSWQELDQQIAFFHNEASGQYGGSLYRNLNYTLWELWIRLHAKGIFPVSDNFTPQLASKEGVEALSELVEVTKYLDPKVHNDGLFENFKSFSKGNKFCNVGWGGTQKYLNGPKSKIKGRLIHALPPGGKIKNSEFQVPYFNWGWNYVVLKQSKEPELSYLFSLFASTRKMSTLSVREREGYFDPFLDDHYKDSKIKGIYTESFLKTHREGMRKSIPDFYVKGQGLYNSALKEGINACLKGQLSPRLAMESVTEKWEKVTASTGRETQVKQWRFLKKSYPSNLMKIFK